MEQNKMVYPITMAGVKRELPLCPLNDDLAIAALVIFGDCQLTTACAQALLDKGVKRVFISLGSEGVYAATAEKGVFLDNPPVQPVSTTGCGDAFMAALVWAWLEGLALEDTARCGLAAASIAMESRQTINPALSATALRERLK